MSKPMSDQDHVVRHCKKKNLIFKDGVVVGFYPEALELRKPSAGRDQETYISATHYEHFVGDHSAKMKACYKATPLELKPKDRLLRFSAGLLKQHGTYNNFKVRVLHMPRKERESYAGIHGLPVKMDVGLNNKLLTTCVVDHIDVESLTAP